MTILDNCLQYVGSRTYSTSFHNPRRLRCQNPLLSAQAQVTDRPRHCLHVALVRISDQPESDHVQNSTKPSYSCERDKIRNFQGHDDELQYETGIKLEQDHLRPLPVATTLFVGGPNGLRS